MKRSIVHYVVRYSPRYLGGFAVVRLVSLGSLRRKQFNSRLRKVREDRLKFTARCTDSQWLLTSALLNSLGLIPSSGMTEAYIKACHQEYYNKWQSDVCFRILVEEREEDLRQFMREYGAHRRYIKRDKDNNDLFLCVRNR